MRGALYMGALAATCYNPAIGALYQRLVGAGKPGKVALVACMRKLLLVLGRGAQARWALDGRGAAIGILRTQNWQITEIA